MRRSLVAFVSCLALVAGVTTTQSAAAGSAAAQAPESAPSPAAHGRELPAVYPKPQSMTARNGRITLGDRAVLITGAGSDPAAVTAVRAILAEAGVTNVSSVDDSRPVPHGVPVFVVGGPDENRATAPALRDLQVGGPQTLAADGYVLVAGQARNQQLVVLAGKDATGTFYAAQTLRQLVTKDHGNAGIPGVQVRDWPSLALRGTIEGFYGYPWSDAQRLRQLDFYGTHKMNTYVYSPKDDPYLRAQWRDPYPADQLAALKTLVDRARANHVEFTYALSPGLSVCYSSAADEQALVAKFQTLWDIGVRTFAVPLDDISYTNWNCDADRAKWGTGGAAAGHAQAYLLNQVQQSFIATHDGAQRLEMVPTEYYTVSNSPYISAIKADLDPSIIVEWTGVGVVPAAITKSQAQAANTVFGHDILIWDNYPVNDYTTSRLLLGPYVGRDPGLPVFGITANPMIQAEASKLALFGVADYTWNDTGYDADAAWQAGITELAGGDPATREALAAFADLEYYSILDTRQAPVLADRTAQFWTAWNAGDARALASLDRYLAVIQGARQTLTDRMDNPSFVTDAAPWLAATELWGSSARAALRMLADQRAGDGAAALTDRAAATAAMAQAKTVTYHGLGGDAAVQVGDGVLDRFINDALTANDRWLGTAGERVTAGSSMATYQSYLPSNMVDGNDATFFWSSAAPNPGDTVQVDLGAVKDISAVKLLMSKSGSVDDYIHDGVLEYSADGTTWTPIGSYSDQAEISADLPAGTAARYVRMRATAAQTNWVVVREFQVVGPDTSVGTVSGTPSAATGSSLHAAADGDPDTAYSAASAPADGDALLLTLSNARPLDAVVVAGTGQADVQVQLDGQWHTIGALAASGYTELTARSAGSDSATAIRLLWTPGSAAPKIAEIVPWYADVAAAEIGVSPAVAETTVATPTELTTTITATRITDQRGRWQLIAPKGVKVKPATRSITVHRGDQLTLPATVSSSTVGEYPVTAGFTPHSGAPVSAAAVLRVHPKVSDTNIALAANGGVATASSTEDDLPQFTPDHAIDGNNGTRWSSNHADGEWLQVKFAAPARLGKVVLRWESAFGKDFTLQTSADGVQWTTAATVSGGLGGVQTLWIEAGDVSYLRMQGVARGTAYGYSLYELQAYPIA
ncbi:beta-N-acetylglucosaminidase domain-containing protein [Nakamurella lactea]|uniref:beta-N-acetylglucosaminidase domain-containing protein n=1 Tax=Nakamurella lactea TaxID=459515 RepID=UPI000420A57D|nr:beta-N-acetylglucosaminidase domain-containing protein [Nakamurella lactea]